MAKSTSRWRQFHTDELRAMFDKLRIRTEELDGDKARLEVRVALCLQLGAELELRGVPRNEMAS